MALTLSDGYVVYKRGAESDSPYWRMVYRRGAADAAAVSSLYNENGVAKYAAAGQRLIALGNQERQKEIALIEMATGTKLQSTTEIRQFIRSFNEVLIGKKQFEDTLVRLESALSKQNQGKEARAPLISSWFTNALGTALNQNITKFVRDNVEQLDKKDFSQWDLELDSIIDKSIDQAFSQLMNKLNSKDGKELYGEQSTWQELYSISQQLNGFNEYFRNIIRSVIDFNQLKHIFKNGEIKIRNKSHLGIRKFVDSKQGLNLKNEKKSRSVGGSVAEVINMLQMQAGEAIASSVNSGSRAFTSNMMSTDTIALYSFEETIDVTPAINRVLEVLDQDMMGNTSLEQARIKMQDFYQQHLSHLNNSFIVYGSTKAYSLSSSFAGFHGGGQRPLESAVDVLTQAGVGNPEALDKYIKAAYNTGEGAILSERRIEIQEELKAGLMSAIAELLFDDWGSLGETNAGAQAIYVLQLDGLQIPLSVLLLATGKAMVETFSHMEQFVKISIHLPGAIEYPTPIKLETENPWDEILEKWNEQATIARNQSYFSVTFLKNFKSIIKEWVNIS